MCFVLELAGTVDRAARLRGLFLSRGPRVVTPSDAAAAEAEGRSAAVTNAVGSVCTPDWRALFDPAFIEMGAR